MNLDLKNYICNKPFENFEISSDGKVFFCCPDWLDKPIGNIHENSFDEIWNSESASLIRNSIADGSYKYCNQKTCPYIVARNLKNKDSEKVEVNIKNIMLNNDLSCNLTCPSCRKDLIVATPGTADYISASKILDKVAEKFININSQKELHLNITGSGDPFASSLYRNFLINLDGSRNPKLKIELQTNGILFNSEMWEKLKNIQKNITKIYLSVDAATPETYAKVRRGGDFKTLISNSKFISNLRQEGKFDLLIARFVVQKENFHEMEKFAKMYLEMGFDLVDFSMVQDWGTWNKEYYNEQKVWEDSNLYYNDFLLELGKIGMQHQRVYLGNFETYRSLAIFKVFSSETIFGKFIYLIFLSIQYSYNFMLKLKFSIQKVLTKRSLKRE